MSWAADTWEGMEGGAGVVINDGYTVSLGAAIQVDLADVPRAAVVQDNSFELSLVSPVVTELT